MINVKPAWVAGAGRKGMEWGFDCFIVLPGVGHLSDLVTILVRNSR